MPLLRRAESPITIRRAIAAPPAVVWDLISSPGHLAECHPFCAANPVDAWPGANAHDTIEYYNGRVVERRFRSWLEGEGYDLEVLDANGPTASVSWRLTASGPGTVLTISLTPRMLGQVPRFVRPLATNIVIRPMMRRYLRAVVRGIEWRATTGEPVRRDQFGAHVWFSRRT